MVKKWYNNKNLEERKEIKSERNDLTPFGYTAGTSGHYVVITGITQEDGVTKFIYNDPRPNSWYNDKEKGIKNDGNQRKIEASIFYKHMKYYQYCAYSQA